MSLVDQSALDADLARLVREVRDPRAGLFGPDSMVWHLSREAVLFLGAGRASLLQLAHPYIGVAVGRHSVTESNPRLRFQRTFHHIFRMTFGDLQEATDSARAVFGTHRRIHGQLGEPVGAFPASHRYNALDREAKVWVLATLWDTTLWIFDQIVHPLTVADRTRFYDEVKRFGLLFGIYDDLPANFSAFERYVRTMLESDVLSVTTHAAAISRVIMRPDTRPGLWLREDYGIFTAHLLPERLVEPLGLSRGGSRGERRFVELLDRARLLIPRLPRRLRLTPGYLAAERRMAGLRGPDWLGAYLESLYLGRRTASQAG